MVTTLVQKLESWCQNNSFYTFTLLGDRPVDSTQQRGGSVGGWWALEPRQRERHSARGESSKRGSSRDKRPSVARSGGPNPFGASRGAYGGDRYQGPFGR